MAIAKFGVDFKLEMLAIAELRPHPRNYNAHPEDQIEHIVESIREHGVYRNIVVARDGTILAGHGVVEAARRAGKVHVPGYRLDLDPYEPRALKVLAGDNEVAHLSAKDDRLLSEILREIKDNDIDGLLGTGYDEMMLANLIFVTRPESEIRDFDEAAEWVGMPEYDGGERPLRVMVSFRNEEDRAEFARILGLSFTERTRATWWPAREREDTSSLRFEG
jgi:ParB-like chromosome segregation protein Spo0J